MLIQFFKNSNSIAEFFSYTQEYVGNISCYLIMFLHVFCAKLLFYNTTLTICVFEMKFN